MLQTKKMQQKSRIYLRSLVYGTLAMYLILGTAWPWLWPDAYYHGMISYIYFQSVINVHLVLRVNTFYDRWLLKGVCMSAGIALIEVIDEINKLVPFMDSDPEKFKWWEYYAAAVVILICLIGVNWFKMLYTCIKEQGDKITVYTKNNISTLWKKITTGWKDWNLHKGRSN